MNALYSAAKARVKGLVFGKRGSATLDLCICATRDAIAKIALTIALRICEPSDMQSSQAAASKGIRIHLAVINQRQTWLAQQLNESPFWLSRRMSGGKTFDVEELDRVAAVFGTTIEGLLSSASAVGADPSRVVSQ